ncbi:hypothetical protein TNCV_3812631 [Trichonephila clavipes]|nr:hypothetical protein TNCV_3812631 [Trichonephila clavipes]
MDGTSADHQEKSKARGRRAERRGGTRMCDSTDAPWLQRNGSPRRILGPGELAMKYPDPEIRFSSDGAPRISFL